MIKAELKGLGHVTMKGEKGEERNNPLFLIAAHCCTEFDLKF